MSDDSGLYKELLSEVHRIEHQYISVLNAPENEFTEIKSIVKKMNKKEKVH